MTSRCPRCRRAILYARTEAGVIMPIDAKPHELGNIMVDRDLLGALVARIALHLKGSGKAHQSHFATCPKLEDEHHPKSPTRVPKPKQKNNSSKRRK